MRKVIILLLLLGGLGYGGYRLYLQRLQPAEEPGRLSLYGNVDLREVQLAFKDAERIATVLAEEGDQVRKGQVLAELETRRLEAAMDVTRASIEAQAQVLERLLNGSRPEEIGAARAKVEQARAELVVAEQSHVRKAGLLRDKVVPQQEVDDSRARLDEARASLESARQNLELVLAGPRKEEIAEARARLAGLEAQLRSQEVTLAESRLVSPLDAQVRNRNLEPGDMAGQQRPVFSLAVLDPKWIRTYVPETLLGRVKPGLGGEVFVDAYPGRAFPGRVGFISPVAEFTPRSVETPELRTSLVYELRFLVEDPAGDLLLGMPATVVFQLPDALPTEEARP